MGYVDKTYPIHRYDSDTSELEIDVKVFGAGFIHISSWRLERPSMKGTTRSILIDPDDIEKLEAALKEAKRRRNSSARRRRRKIDR